MENRHLNISKLIAFLIVASIFLVPASCVAVPYIFKPTVNPFDYISVTFDGIDGEGMARIELIKTDSRITSLDDFGVTISKEYNLCEGETVTVYTDTLTSPYWHTQNSKEYIVEGLELFLTDLNTIDENASELIEQKSLQILSGNISDTPQIQIDSHEKYYLLTDNKQSNLLYDVYEATWSLADGTEKQIYLVAYYTDIIVHGGDNATFSYDDCMYTGNMLSTNDYRDSVVYGFESLEDIELELNTNRDPDATISEK